MHNKLQKGFSLVEALVALFIIGLFVGTLFKFQGNLVSTTQIGHNTLDKISLAHNTFVTADQEGWYKKIETKKLENVQGARNSIVYKVEQISKNSSLNKIKNLYLETVDILGQQNSVENSFVGFKFYPGENKSE